MSWDQLWRDYFGVRVDDPARWLSSLAMHFESLSDEELEAAVHHTADTTPASQRVDMRDLIRGIRGSRRQQQETVAKFGCAKCQDRGTYIEHRNEPYVGYSCAVCCTCAKGQAMRDNQRRRSK